jgi:hypothetical protein
MVGGLAGGEYDPHDDSLYEAIVLGPDSTFKLYINDTLAWQALYRVFNELDHNSKQHKGLVLFSKNGEQLNLGVTFEDFNHIWTREKNTMDAFSFLYVRYR